MGCAQLNSSKDKAKTQNTTTITIPENPKTIEQCMDLSKTNNISTPNQHTIISQKLFDKNTLKNEEIPNAITIQFKLHEKVVKSINLNSDATIKDVIVKFKNSPPIFPNHFPLPKFRTLSNKYFLDSNSLIESFLEKKSHELIVLVEPVGLTDFPWDSDIKYVNQIEKIAKPLANPFGLAVFNTKTKRIYIEEDYLSDNDNSQINLYSNISAYCNGLNNYLYISGGEEIEKKSVLANFWIVDLNKKIPEHISLQMPVSKKNHSMIFIPEKYVFIVGGNNKETFYYDIHLKTFFNWGPLNKETIQPSLAVINNCYLYAFTGFAEMEISFEKNNLRLTRSVWDIIVPKLDPSCKFTQELFGVCQHKQDSIVFIGGNNKSSDEPSYCCEYNYGLNTLQASNQRFENIELSEKCFISVGNAHAFLLPNFQRKEPRLLAYIKSVQMYGTIQFTQENQKSEGTIENSLSDDCDKMYKVKSENGAQLGKSMVESSNLINKTGRKQSKTGGVVFFYEN